MASGNQQAAPIVYDGVMYLASPGGTVHALDGANGDLLWEYRHEVEGDAPRAVGDPRSEHLRRQGISETVDARLVALDARPGSRCGTRRWQTPRRGFRFPPARLSRVDGSFPACRGAPGITRRSARSPRTTPKTGKELWRTDTSARPGQPGSDTWGDVPSRSGRHRYVDSGQLRPRAEPDLWSTAQAKPWPGGARHRRRRAVFELHARARSRNREDRLVSPVRAGRNPGHGRRVRDHPRRFAGRSSLFKMGKLESSGRSTSHGRILRATDLGYQNVLRSIGRAARSPIARQDPETQRSSTCVRASGRQELAGDGLQSGNARVLHPAQLTCAKIAFGDVKKVEGAGQRRGDATSSSIPTSGGDIGEFVAMRSPARSSEAPTARDLQPAALTTAGGLAFVGD